MEINKFLTLAFMKYPHIKYRYTDEGKWYTLYFLDSNDRFIISKRSLRNETVAYNRLKQLIWFIKEKI